MLKQMKETNNKFNANTVGVAPQGDPQTKNTLKEHSNLTSQKGITLIALVITIIIMLILVTVTITVALKGELFNTAKQAKTETENKINEEQNLASGKVEIDGKWYNSIEEYTTGRVTPTEDNYGDFVEYGIDLDGDGNYENDWKVFYVGSEDDGYPETNGKTFIIAADYVNGDKCNALQTAAETNSHMTKNSDVGYEYCYYWDNNDVEGDEPKVTYYCNDGHNKELNKEKNQCSFPEIFMGTGYYCSDHVGTDGKGENPNSRCASSLMCTDNWNGFVDSSYGATYAIGGPTLEMWVASWNKKHGKDVDKDNGITLCAKPKSSDSSCTGYCIGEGENATDTYYDITSCTDGYNDTLYFPHQSNYNDLDKDNSDEYCWGYWLASPSAYSSSSLMYVICNGYVNYSNYNYSDLRPPPRSLSNIWSQIGKNCRAIELSRFWNTE